MMRADIVNGLFEAFGALMLLLNVRRLVRDRQIAGVHWGPTVFFTSWGLWNLFYYPHLHQWASFAGGIAIVVMNAVWLALVARFSLLESPAPSGSEALGPSRLTGPDEAPGTNSKSQAA